MANYQAAKNTEPQKMKYPQTNEAYLSSTCDDAGRVDSLLSMCETMEDQRNVARVVAADAIREIERIFETGNTYCTREIVANLKEALTPESFLHDV